MKHDSEAVDTLIASQEDEDLDTQVRDFGFKRVSRASSSLISTVSSMSPSDSHSSTVTTWSSSSSMPLSPVSPNTKLFEVLSPGVDFLTEDVKNNSSFMTCVKSVEASILYFMHLREAYSHSKQRDRQTVLRRNLEAIDGKIAAVVDDIKKVSEIKLNSSLGLDTLTQTCAQKQKMLSQLVQSLLALKPVVSSPELLNNLRRRLKQKQKKVLKEYSVECLHTPHFTWKKAFDALDAAENAGHRSSPLDYHALRLDYCGITVKDVHNIIVNYNSMSIKQLSSYSHRLSCTLLCTETTVDSL